MRVRTAICAWPIKSTNAMTGVGEKVMIHKDCDRGTSIGGKVHIDPGDQR